MEHGVNQDIDELAVLSARLAEMYTVDQPPDITLQLVSDALRAVQLARSALDFAVLRARQGGASWAKIGRAADCSTQNAHERWRDLEHDDTDR
jgi:hypothetical protein